MTNIMIVIIIWGENFKSSISMTTRRATKTKNIVINPKLEVYGTIFGLSS